MLATLVAAGQPPQMRFKLRQGVVQRQLGRRRRTTWSIPLQRAMSKTSTYAIYTQGMDRIARWTQDIDIFLKNPNPCCSTS